MPVDRFREGPYYRGFLKTMYEDFVGAWQTVRIREMSIYMKRFDCIDVI